jgi:hypothetical protein
MLGMLTRRRSTGRHWTGAMYLPHQLLFSPIIWRPFGKLELAAAIFAFVAIPGLAFGQQGSPSSKAPKPTKADVQKVAQIISSDKAKLQTYSEPKKLYDQMAAAYKKNDSKTADALSKKADALASKIGPEYSKVMDGLEQVDPNASEGKEFMSILSGSTNSAPALRWLRPINLRPINLSPINLRLSNLRLRPLSVRLPKPRRLKLRRRNPVSRSERRAERLASFPMAPVWALGS